VIECGFKVVTCSTGGEAPEEKSKFLMTILGKSLPKGNKLSYVAAYEGIKLFFAKITDESRRENGSAVVENRETLPWSEMGKEFELGVAALLLPNSPSENDQSNRYFPIPENCNTEAVRVARARAVVAYLSCVRDAQAKARALTAVKLWLKSERSGQVRDLLHEASAGILSQEDKAL
jgi:hypothetical protein